MTSTEVVTDLEPIQSQLDDEFEAKLDALERQKGLPVLGKQEIASPAEEEEEPSWSDYARMAHRFEVSGEHKKAFKYYMYVLENGQEQDADTMVRCTSGMVRQCDFHQLKEQAGVFRNAERLLLEQQLLQVTAVDAQFDQKQEAGSAVQLPSIHSADFDENKVVDEVVHLLPRSVVALQTQAVQHEQLGRMLLESGNKPAALGYIQRAVTARKSVCQQYGVRCVREITAPQLDEINEVDRGRDEYAEALEVYKLRKGGATASSDSNAKDDQSSSLSALFKSLKTGLEGVKAVEDRQVAKLRARQQQQQPTVQIYNNGDSDDNDELVEDDVTDFDLANQLGTAEDDTLVEIREHVDGEQAVHKVYKRKVIDADEKIQKDRLLDRYGDSIADQRQQEKQRWVKNQEILQTIRGKKNADEAEQPTINKPISPQPPQTIDRRDMDSILNTSTHRRPAQTASSMKNIVTTSFLVTLLFFGLFIVLALMASD